MINLAKVSSGSCGTTAVVIVDPFTPHDARTVRQRTPMTRYADRKTHIRALMAAQPGLTYTEAARRVDLAAVIPSAGDQEWSACIRHLEKAHRLTRAAAGKS